MKRSKNTSRPLSVRVKIFRVVFIVVAAILLAPFIAYFCLSLYAYTGPHSLPKLAHTLDEKIQGKLPEKSSLKFQDLQILHEKKVSSNVLKLTGVEFHQPDLDLKFEGIEFYLDFLALVPGVGRSFLNIHIQSPHLEKEKQKKGTHKTSTEEEVAEKEPDPRMYSKIKDAIEHYRFWIKNLHISIEENSITVLDLIVHADTYGEELSLSVHGDIPKKTEFKLDAVIPDVKAKKIRLNIEADSKGSIQDLVAFAEAYLHMDTKKLKNVQGSYHLKSSGNIPLSSKHLVNNMQLTVHTDFDVPKIYEKYGLTKGTFDVDLKYGKMHLRGVSSISNRIPLFLEGDLNLISKDKKITLKSSGEWKEFAELDFPGSKSLSGRFDLTAYMSEYASHKNAILNIDLSNTGIDNLVGINKKVGEPGRISLDLDSSEKKTSTLQYNSKLGTHETQGVAFIFDNPKDQFEIKFSSIRIKGPKDSVAELEFHLKDKEFHLSSKNVGAFLSMMDFSDKVIDGQLDFKGTLLPDRLKGEVVLKKFKLGKISIFIKILALGAVSLSSLKGLESVLAGKGMEFSVLLNSFTYVYAEKELQVNKLNIAGNVLNANLEGNLYLTKKSTAHLSGILAPSKLIKAAARTGHIIGKKDGPPIALQYKVVGNLDEPTISVHLLNFFDSSAFVLK